MLVTDRRQARRPLAEIVGAAVRGGTRWVLLREKDLPVTERAAVAVELRAILAPVGGRLIVAGPDPLGGDAVHLPAVGPHPAPASPAVVGRSCHDAAELDRLSTEDFVTLSPVFASRSKPGYGPVLGLTGLAELVRRSPVAVLALGGIEAPDQAAGCGSAGAAGVAVMGGLMRAADPEGLARALGDAFQTGRADAVVGRGAAVVGRGAAVVGRGAAVVGRADALVGIGGAEVAVDGSGRVPGAGR